MDAPEFEEQFCHSRRFAGLQKNSPGFVSISEV